MRGSRVCKFEVVMHVLSVEQFMKPEVDYAAVAELREQAQVL